MIVRGVLRLLLMAAGITALVAASWAADDSPARLRAAALVEEGDLLLEELAALEPIRQRERLEAQRLSVTEKKLAAELPGVEKDVQAYNQAVAALNAAAAEHTRACPGNLDAGAVEQCNERGAALMNRAAALDRQHTALEAQQRDLNARLEQHNRAREAWLAAHREHAPRLDANAADAQRWVSVARSFMLTRDFAALSARAGQPAACAELRLSDAGAYFGATGLKRLHACLEAVLRAP